MADIPVTAASVGPVYPNSHTTVLRNYTALVDITAGQSVYGDPTTGNVGLCDANAAGNEQFLGIAMHTKKAGETVQVLEQGEVYGFTLAGNYFALIYQSDTAGSLADAASGTKTVVVGKIKPINDGATQTKVLHVQTWRTNNW